VFVTCFVNIAILHAVVLVSHSHFRILMLPLDRARSWLIQTIKMSRL